MPDTRLSPDQALVVQKSTQIYSRDSLQYLHGEAEGNRRADAMVNEVICQIGKGGGKNFISTVSIAYLIHKILCLKNPHRYYDKPRGDSIDLLNIAINSAQAANNFFNPFSERVHSAPWFRDKIVNARGADIEFANSVHAYSGHSEREGWEGYNLIAAVLDEIAGFSTESASDNPNAKTAGKIYKTYRASVTSRYPDYGKLILLSFPRYKKDFISTRYEEVIAAVDRNKETVTLVRNEELPADMPGNSYELSYELDDIKAYVEPRVFAIRRPSYIFNPNRNLEDYKGDIFYDPVDALTRFFCMPPDAQSAFFRNVLPLQEQFGEEALRTSPFVDDTWQFKPSFKPDPEKQYYCHVDIGYAFDRAAVAMSHIDGWTQQKSFAADEPVPNVVLDCLRYWTPSSSENVSLEEIKQFILELRFMGFDIQRVTFDQFQSVKIIQELNSLNVLAEKLPVGRTHYGEFAIVLYDGRFVGYRESEALNEFVGLRLIKGNKVDHPVKGSNDLADAIVGSVYGCLEKAEAPKGVVEIRTFEDMHTPVEVPEQEQAPVNRPKMPANMREFLDMQAI